MDAAFQLVGAGPAAGALLFLGARRPRARDAPDRAEADIVERVVRNLVDLDVGPDALLVPVGQRVHLPDVVALRPLHLRRGRAARRLVSAGPGDPGFVGLERVEERLDLAHVAAAVGVGLPEVRAFLAVLLRDGDQRRTPQRQPRALAQPGRAPVGLAGEEGRVEPGPPPGG